MQRAAAKRPARSQTSKKSTTPTSKRSITKKVVKKVVKKRTDVKTRSTTPIYTKPAMKSANISIGSSTRKFSSKPVATFPTFSEGPILTDLVDGGVLVVKFNNPTMLNAMNVDMGNKMVEICDSLRNDNGQNVKAVILTGIGRGFSAGGDLTFLAERSRDTPANNVTKMLQFYNRFLGLRTVPVPVIAAINGPAIGAGAAVASLADYRICSSSATIGWTFANLGLHPGMASTHYLPKMTKPSIATHLLLSGEIIGAQTAKEYDIVNDIVQVDGEDLEVNNKKLLEHAINHAHEYTKFHSLASFTLLKNLRAQQDVGLQNAIKDEAMAQALTYASPEFQARLEKMINRKK